MGTKSKKMNRSNSSSPIHSFSNPNSPLTETSKLSQSVTLTSTKSKMPSINIGASRSQQLFQKQKYMKISNNTAAYHAKIGADFVPYDEEEKLNQKIRDINDDLQYLLDINKTVNDLVYKQQENVDGIEQKVQNTANNVEDGMDSIQSIRKSPITYGVMGGLFMASLGAPIILVAAGIKAAVGGAVRLGAIGGFTG